MSTLAKQDSQVSRTRIEHKIHDTEHILTDTIDGSIKSEINVIIQEENEDTDGY